jgi:hypothetical protein
VKAGEDVADQHIVEHARAGDLAVTADIPPAALLVEKRVRVLDPRGETNTAENIGERPSVRDFMDSLRSTGVDTGGPKPYGEREKREFASALHRTLTAAHCHVARLSKVMSYGGGISRGAGTPAGRPAEPAHLPSAPAPGGGEGLPVARPGPSSSTTSVRMRTAIALGRIIPPFWRSQVRVKAAPRRRMRVE